MKEYSVTLWLSGGEYKKTKRESSSIWEVKDFADARAEGMEDCVGYVIRGGDDETYMRKINRY